MRWLRLSKDVFTIEFSPGYNGPVSPLGNYLIAVEHSENRLIIHDAYTRIPCKTIEHVIFYAFSPDETLLALITSLRYTQEVLTVYNWPSMEVRATFQQPLLDRVGYSTYLRQFVAFSREAVRAYDHDATTVRCLASFDTEGHLQSRSWDLFGDLCMLQTDSQLRFLHLRSGAWVSAELASADAPIAPPTGDVLQGPYTVDDIRDVDGDDESLSDAVSHSSDASYDDQAEADEEMLQQWRREVQPAVGEPTPRLPFQLKRADVLLFEGGIAITWATPVSEISQYGSQSRMDVWDVSNGALLQRRFFNRTIVAAGPSPDRKTLMLSLKINEELSYDRSVFQLRSVPSLDCIFEHKCPSKFMPASRLQLSRRGDLLVDYGGWLNILRVETEEVVWRRRRLLWIARCKDPLSFWSRLPASMFRLVVQYV
eukprot:GILK01003418.1.p1 GENE.GILK01003418.1~~GILK01003418.1.p1  ORF type:complete len:426 (-),score=35.53 GILK01003418.1:198-1475(-)